MSKHGGRVGMTGGTTNRRHDLLQLFKGNGYNASIYGLTRAYHPFESLAIFTTNSITCTSINTPTTVANAAPYSKPNKLMAVATASSKKLLAPINADGAATQCTTPRRRFSQYAKPELNKT